MSKRPGMMIYFDQWEYVATILTPEQFKRLFMLLMDKAQNLDVDAPDDDQAVSMAYHLLLPQLYRDAARYEKICEKRRAAINKRWNNEALQHDEVQMNTSEYKCIQNIPTTTTTTTTTPTTTTTTISLPLPPQGKGDGEREIPTVEEIMEYGKDAGYERVDEATARSFIGQQAARGWLDSGGNVIRDWKSWFSGWYTRNVIASVRPMNQPTSMQYDQRAYTPDELRALTDFMEGNDDG